MGLIRSGDAIIPITSRLPRPPQTIDSAFALPRGARHQTEKAKVASSIEFGARTAFLMSDDVSIARTLAGIYGNDVTGQPSQPGCHSRSPNRPRNPDLQRRRAALADVNNPEIAAIRRSFATLCKANGDTAGRGMM